VGEKIPITSCYGPRRLLNKFHDFHEGVDFGARSNSPVHAVAPGKVIWIGSMGCAGHTIIIQHRLKGNRTVLSLYKHLKQFQVAVGQRVKGGQRIAFSGSSGKALKANQAADKRGCVTGPHLHVEFKFLKDETNPQSFAKILRDSGGRLSELAVRANPGQFLSRVKNRCSASGLDRVGSPVTKLNRGED
jgi:murein DD-endopeptidase MepM/ murein hydrolase activator NlpD